ncbi:flagellin N-terminal helical domain-containing protein [Clostridium tagluense]|uniref:flagellin N-terminal helical domain-containing protein n=1 Tax=Clostridium tagluense TaxID=360422 RepID=UPI001C0D88D3|nr:flagellin [Clostridium tagluense]MBU3126675.1 flagellin [Clostridium tagluense]
MIINHNMNAMNSHRQMVGNTANAGKSMEKLSSGLRINRAGDDAAGLAISEKMRGQIRGLDQGSRNAQDSISMIQTAEGSLNETHSILQRMRELSVQSSNDTNNSTDRSAIQEEVNQLANEIDRIGNTTEFNTKKLLNGDVVGVNADKKGTAVINNNTSIKTINVTAAVTTAVGANSSLNGAVTVTLVSRAASGTGTYDIRDTDGTAVAAAEFADVGSSFSLSSGLTGATGGFIATADMSQMKVGESLTIVFNKHVAATNDTSKSITAQIGANSGQTMQIGINDMRGEALGIKDSAGIALSVLDKYAANSAISTIQNAIENVSAERSKLGSIQNRFEHTISNLGTASENLQSSESRIRDVDMAKEMMNFSKNNILSQAAQAMLSQANQQPQGVLQLLR